MLGSVLLWAWVWLWGSLLTVLGLVLSVPFNPWFDRRRVMMAWLSGLWGRGVMWVLPGIRIELKGQEHLAHGPVMICPNHVSVADIIMLLAVMPAFKFVAKSPLFFLPPIGLHLRLAGYIRAGTGDERDGARVLEDCERWFGLGCHVLWFPEGTRSDDGRTVRFRSGPFHIARQAGVKVVPTAITGTREVILKKGLRYHFKSTVRITLLPPFAIEGDAKQAAARARALVDEQLALQSAPLATAG